MRIEVDRLDERGEAFAHAYAADELTLDEDARLIDGARVEGRAGRKGNEIRLSGRLAARVEARCDRCARPVEVPVDVEFSERLIPTGGGAGAPDAAELQADDLAFSVYEGDAVDVDDLVREQILLALPTRLLCREDCKGLCPDCGADLNLETCACEHRETDPRWAGLAALKNDDGE